MISAAIIGALAYFAWQVWLVGETAIAIAAAAIGLIGIWQLEPLVRHNKAAPLPPRRPAGDAGAARLCARQRTTSTEHSAWRTICVAFEPSR